ncbi:MAG: hypothetical protein KDD69_15585, partial [Bdellovibrionales bacterium]|nr:hypothetical protein [Bdellovibrionales bacterium]
AHSRFQGLLRNAVVTVVAEMFVGTEGGLGQKLYEAYMLNLSPSLYAYIRELRKRLACSIVCVLHYLEDALQLSDHVLVFPVRKSPQVLPDLPCGILRLPCVSTVRL